MPDQNGPILLVDGRNSAYRAIHASRSGDNQGYRRPHGLVVMLRFMCTWFNDFRPSAIHVFWDAPRESTWRRQVYPTYKLREQPSGDRDVAEELAAVQAAARDILTVLKIRQLSKERMEADDLIYAACRVLHPKKSIVVSSDGDFTQLAYYFNSVTVYEPRIGKTIEMPEVNPVYQKALMGDHGDKIDGYPGIGPVKSNALCKSPMALDNFLVEHGNKILARNLALIDLSLCPYVLSNMVYVTRQLARPVTFDRNAIMALAKKHQIVGLLSEYDRICQPLRTLE